jgi:hypothetical protein
MKLLIDWSVNSQFTHMRNHYRVTRWARSHPWAAAYLAVLLAVALFTALAAAADWAESTVVLFALCAVALGAFFFDALRNQDDSQRDQTE